MDAQNKISVCVETIPEIYASEALIVYVTRNGFSSMQEKEIVHYKINEDGEYIEPHALNIRAMQDIFNSAGGNQKMKLLDPRILAINNTGIVWYEPNRIEKINFEVPEPNRKDLNKLCKGKAVHWPTLVFKIEGTRLICYAIKGTKRPTLKTKLYVAPLTHINPKDGWVCMPQNLRVDLHLTMQENMGRISENFYNGIFGHATGNDQANHPGGHDGLWREILTQNPKHFPDNYLNPTEKTLADLLK